MMINVVQELKFCINESEIIELMKDEKLSPFAEAKIFDDIIMLPDAHDFLVPSKIPNNDYGLAIRLISYLRFNGYIGYVNYGSGIYQYLNKFLTLWNEFNTIKEIKNINDIDSILFDEWLKKQIIRKNTKHIMVKIRALKHWQSVNQLLPYFLSLKNNIIDEHNKLYLEIEKRYNQENISEDDSSSIYPFQLLSPILEESIKYINNFTEDTNFLMSQRFYLNSSEISKSTRSRRCFSFIKETEYIFTEPTLKELQQYCQNSKELGIKDEDGFNYRSMIIINKAIQRWQAANLIILIFFSAARSNEITRQPRNIKVTKTKYHELDKGYNFTRIIWKTSRFGKLHTIPLPPLAMKAYENLSYHSEQTDSKKTGRLIFINWSNINGRMNANRVRYLLFKFSEWVHDDAEEFKFGPHKLRHAMATLINYLNDKNGLMIAAKLLDHQSMIMSLTYQVSLKTMILNKINHLSNTNQEVAKVFKEYEEEKSLKVLNEVLMPDLIAKKSFFGPAKSITQFTGTIVNDAKSFFLFYSQAIKDGKIVLIQTPICLCFHSTSSKSQMACQRGIDVNNYERVPVQPATCQGSSCSNSLFTEQNCEMLMQQTQSIKDLAPKELLEMAKQWFYVVGDGLDLPNQQIINEYKEKIKNTKVV